jgi:hypothetical protein
MDSTVGVTPIETNLQLLYGYNDCMFLQMLKTLTQKVETLQTDMKAVKTDVSVMKSDVKAVHRTTVEVPTPAGTEEKLKKWGLQGWLPITLADDSDAAIVAALTNLKTLNDILCSNDEAVRDLVSSLS